MEDFPVASRLKILINALGLNDSQFADQCGISRPTLSLLLAGKNKKISDIMLSQIHNRFPKVSILWLLFDEGTMFVEDKDEAENRKNSDEIAILSDYDKKNDEELNLVNLKQLENIIKEVINQSFKESKNSLENFILKISEPENLRKASKITVYYDDSTFETFIPEK